MSSKELREEACHSIQPERVDVHFTVHQFVNERQTPLPRYDALRDGEIVICSIAHNNERWITPLAIAEKPDSKLPAIEGKAFYYKIQPPAPFWASAIRPSLKEWGEPVTTDEEYSLEELEEFQCGIGAAIQLSNNPAVFTSSSLMKRRQDLSSEREGESEFPSPYPKRPCPDNNALYHLIPKPHTHPSPFIPNPISLISYPLFWKAQPSYIFPYDSVRFSSIPATSRFTWVIPVCGRLPLEGSTPASLFLHDLPPSSEEDQPRQEIQWTSDSLLSFWDHLLTMQKSGGFGSFGVSFHSARKRHTHIAGKIKRPKVSPPISTQGLPAKDTQLSLLAVDHIKVYHDGFTRLQLRTLLDRFTYKVSKGGHTGTTMVLEGARFVLLDNCGRAVMLL